MIMGRLDGTGRPLHRSAPSCRAGGGAPWTGLWTGTRTARDAPASWTGTARVGMVVMSDDEAFPGAVAPTSVGGGPSGRPQPTRSPLQAGGRFLPSLHRLWLVVVLSTAFGVVNAFPVDQMDYWWTVKLGADLWETRQLPTTNTLTFTPTREPYVEQQWLAQLLLAAVHERWGLRGALFLRGILMVLVLGLLYHVCRRTGAGPTLAGVICITTLALIFPGAAVRPQLLALPLFMLFLAGTTIWQRQLWIFAALPLAMTVWANLHGSFPLGLALVASALLGRLWEVRPPSAALVDEQAWRWAALLALCAGAVLVNPYGVHVVPWLADFLSVHASGQEGSAMASEWLPTSLGERVGAYYFASVLLLVVVLVKRGPPRPSDGVRLVLFGLLALTAIRSTTWWGLVLAPAMAWSAARWVQTRGSAARPEAAAMAAPRDPYALQWLRAGLLVVSLLAAVWSVPMVRGALLQREEAIADPTQPRALAEYVASLPGGLRLVNDVDWGGYLGWRLAPWHLIFADERYGLYSPQVFRDYARVSEARPGWETVLAGYQVSALVVDWQHQPDLAQALAQDGMWQLEYCDAQGGVYLWRDQAARPPMVCPPH